MINFDNFAETHLAADFDGQDWDDREDDGWSERDDFDDEHYFGGEDAYLDTYWESVFEFDYEPPF